MAGGWSGERPDQSVDQSAHLLDQVQICRKIPLRKVAESDRTQSDCETIGILEDEDDSSNSEFTPNAVTPPARSEACTREKRNKRQGLASGGKDAVYIGFDLEQAQRYAG